FVFFEASASAPFQIRKIEELNKTSSGAVEAKVVCFYRRQDLASSLVQLADAHQRKFSQYFFSMPVLFFSNLEELLKNLKEHASPEQVHQLKHRELFLSRHLEVLPATHIRGKCHVTLRSETEPCMSYLQKDDAFFFQLVYDPVNKTLQADRGAIRIGDNYQAVVPERISIFALPTDSIPEVNLLIDAMVGLSILLQNDDTTLIIREKGETQLVFDKIKGH
ncbi:unnamed protein product, partial [Schistocephalus solidus]|uniref:BAH domain-containing protein n=1 Tax=Schistocephalus solidus TaxID=70667 RepID=A0A183SNS2_SCHSO